MWTPTHVQVTIHRARNLIPKGKNGTNDSYVTIALGKEKYQTSVKEKSENPEWHEECDLPIPGMESDLILNCFHRNLLGLDEFLGHVTIPLQQFQIYERPKSRVDTAQLESRWYAFKNKPNSKKAAKYRGDIEVKVTFIVQSLSKSELSLNKVRRSGSFRSLANSVGEKFHSKMERKKSKHEISSDCSDSPTQLPKHELLKLSKSSPGKLEKRRRSVSQEVLATTPSFEIASSIHLLNSPSSDGSHADNSSIDSRDSLSTSSNTPTKENRSTHRKHIAPPKPPRTLLKEKSSESEEQSAQSNTDLDNDLCLTKLQRSPKQYRSKESITECGESISGNSQIKTPNDTLAKSEASENNVFDTSNKLGGSEQSLEGKSEGYDRSGEDEDYFSRTNSFRQAIQRGSLRKSGGRKGRAQGETQHSPLLTGVRRSYGQSDSNPSIDTLPEDTSTPSQKQMYGSLPKELNKSDNNEESTSLDKSSEKIEPMKEEKRAIPNMSPRLRTKLSKQDPTRRHTFGYSMKEVQHVTTHDIHQTIQDAKRENQDGEQTLPNEVLDQFKGMEREDLIKLILKQNKEVELKNKYTKELEDYIDNLLVRVIEVQPRILQTPYPSPYLGSHSISISSGVRIGVSNEVGGHRTPNYPPPAYSSSNVVVSQNNNRNLIQQQQEVRQQNSYNNRSRISPPKLIKAGQNNFNKKDKKTSNPFKKLLKN